MKITKGLWPCKKGDGRWSREATNFGIFPIANLPWWQALIMLLVSIFLTAISGFIPARSAAKKDPAVALRTE